MKCSCRGHCGNGKHHRKVGFCHKLVHRREEEKAWCDECRCPVEGCIKGLSDGPVCYHHRKIMDKLDETMRCMWLYRDTLRHMTPCDLTVLLLPEVWRHIGACEVLKTFCFLIKEPTPVMHIVDLVKTMPQRTTRSYRADVETFFNEICLPLARYMNGKLMRKEHENLNQQGARHFCTSHLPAVPR